MQVDLSVAPPARRRLSPVIAGAALAAALAGCAARAPGPLLPYDPLRETAAVRAAATAFIAAEARGDRAADTLLAPDADFIDGGIPVSQRPRLAAVVGRGTGTVDDLRIQLAGELAWVVASYRWIGEAAAGGSDEVEHGWATIILQRRGALWRIRHVHSSTVPPWR